jgi:5-hydroxyisourate hydrolase
VSRVTTHVLDTSRGLPAAGIAVELERVSEPPEHVDDGVTDDDGRIGDLGPDDLPDATYRLTFHTGGYFERVGVATLFPTVSITFVASAGEPHFHVPLLLSPFAYSTYRGS